MKTIVLGVAIALFTINAQAQNTNVQDVTKTTTTTIKDSEGEKKVITKENTQQTQDIELQNSKTLNKDIKDTPVQVVSSVQVTGPDGRTRNVDVDRSGFYTMGDKKFQVIVDNVGYTVMDPMGKKYGVLRNTPSNNYIYKGKNRSSVVYFDKSGNLYLETYDEKVDKVTVETFMKNP